MNHKNKVELIGWYGGDLTHAQSAWTSTNREMTSDKLERLPKLLNMLASEGHHTPFEKSMLHFLVETDIATHIHILKHRINVSTNGESARYKEIKEDKFLVPDDWDIGSYNPIELTDNDLILDKWANKLIDASNETNKMYHECLEELTPILGRKRAKESARFFKMYNSQIIADVSFNWRSFMHFQSLRNAEGAQKEVRDIAQQMMDIVKEIPGNPFKHSILSFENIK